MMSAEVAMKQFGRSGCLTVSKLIHNLPALFFVGKIFSGENSAPGSSLSSDPGAVWLGLESGESILVRVGCAGHGDVGEGQVWVEDYW